MLIKRIQLSQGKVAIVDDADYPLVCGHKWCAIKSRRAFYAATHVWRGARRFTLCMHRLIMGEPSCEIDHKDGNGLNNRRSNLRRASDSQQAANRKMRSDNSSGFKGVHWHNQSGTWRAKVTYRGKTRTCQRKTAKAAAREYGRMAKEIFGQFARVR